MFKKTLLAATLAAITTSAMAVNVADNSTPVTYGSEGLSAAVVANDFSVLTMGAAQLKLGAEYSVGDTITISIAGGEFDPTDAFELTDSNGITGVGITAGFLSATATQLLFRITAIDSAVTTVGETMDLELSGPVALPIKLSSSAVGSKLTLSASAATSTGLLIDTAGAKDSVAIGSVIQQHKFARTTALDTDIDVADERKALALANGTAALSDTATLTYTAATPDQAAFTLSGTNDVTMTVNGSFTGFETGVTGSTALGTITIDGDNATVAADLLSGKNTFDNPSTAGTVDFVLTPNAVKASRVVLNTSAYSVDAVLTNGTKTFTYSGISLGSLALNGASENFGYVPVNYGGAVTTQFEIGNKGSVDGEITLSGFDTAGNDYDKVLPFKAQAGKLTKISDADISTAFGLTAGTKLKLTITVNSPASNISMAGYSNRGTTGRMAVSATTN